jgi:hypothetical protein
MATKKTIWKKAAGKLGFMQPLLGSWIAETGSPMGPLKCTRIFKTVLGGKYIELNARWQFGKGAYEEHAIYGLNGGQVSFWSFTSDGKKSQGSVADGKDVHAEAICFEAQMTAGLARMIYWPGDDGSMHWAVESKVKKGWNRFTEHHYRPVKST